ncbi:DUF3307 domain-containing protein [Flavobacterium sedimenticola]|uniref:DUF3307 domain-containing protein n=1 Tax=Flavobacterium sedimenticola TaxID=3043286 RepID=A0ABT6XQQ1_9FLAO|nr:DUF3307 domain-containing protein [Flavobacterium sedimenticola]MDI9256984.1 DUF3307 domain-containing protein [Flavobacterium sedimenticola]
MIIFIKLLLAHIIGDFIVQPDAWVADKEKKIHRSMYLYLHTLLHAVLAYVLVGEKAFAAYALLLAFLHGGIDFLKLRFQRKENKRRWFIADQWLHVLVIIGITFGYNGELPDFSFADDQFWILVTALIFLTKPTSIIIKNIISIWTPENKWDKNDDSLQNAGNYIGILERLFVFYFVTSGHLEAVGFLLAAKSIFRFGDLKEAKDRKLTEYVLIGTLLSFGMAFLVGLLVQYGLLFC